MYERFTDRARLVMHLAETEARSMDQQQIGTEHILIALADSGANVAYNVLKKLGISQMQIRRAVGKLVRECPKSDFKGRLHQSRQNKNVIKNAIIEARALKHNYIGTEHILLGICRQPDCVAAAMLIDLGLSLDDIRDELHQVIGYEEP